MNAANGYASKVFLRTKSAEQTLPSLRGNAAPAIGKYKHQMVLQTIFDSTKPTDLCL